MYENADSHSDFGLVETATELHYQYCDRRIFGGKSVLFWFFSQYATVMTNQMK